MEKSRGKGGKWWYALIQKPELLWVYFLYPVLHVSLYFFSVFQETWRHVLWGRRRTGEGPQRWKTIRNEAAGDESWQNQGWDGRKTAERVQQERKWMKKNQKWWMAEDGQQVTRLGKKSEIILCIGPRVPKGTWRVGRDVGLLPRFVLLGSPLPHPQSHTTKASNTYSPVAANEATHYPAALQQQWG